MVLMAILRSRRSRCSLPLLVLLLSTAALLPAAPRTVDAVSVTGGPNKKASVAIPLFSSKIEALPKDLLDALIQDASVHASLTKTAAGSLKFGKLPTNWYPLSKKETHPPRFAAELAVKLFQSLDLANGVLEQHKIVGAEWWYQIRERDEQIGYHYDKDEAVASLEMRLSHPVLGTVTYLTDHGGPTVVFNQTSIDGNENLPPLPEYGGIFYPEKNKHITFHGHFMHGVQNSLAIKQPPTGQPRITFLVNWWAEVAQPPNCRPLSDAHAALFMESSGHLTRRADEFTGWSKWHSRKLVAVDLGREGTRVDPHLHTFSLPPDTPFFMKFTKPSRPADYAVSWTPTTMMGGVEELNLFEGGSLQRAFASALPKVFLFYDKSAQVLGPLLEIFSRAIAPFRGDILPFSAEKQVTGDAMLHMGVADDMLPTVCIHDTVTGNMFRLNGLFSERSLAQFMESFWNGLLNPIVRDA